MSLTRCSARSPSTTRSRRSLPVMGGGLARFSVSVLATSRCFRHDLNYPISDGPPEAPGHREGHHRFALGDGIEHIYAKPLAKRSDLLQEGFLGLPPADESSR